jgi:hypothetical protein
MWRCVVCEQRKRQRDRREREREREEIPTTIVKDV